MFNSIIECCLSSVPRLIYYWMPERFRSLVLQFASSTFRMIAITLPGRSAILWKFYSKMTRDHGFIPCAGCRMLRKRCVEECALAPYFLSNDLQKFAIAHKVFGATAIMKTLQDLPVQQRAEAVNSMVYEATARLKDPVHGCAGMIFQLQKQSQLAMAQAEILDERSQQAKLVASISGFDASVEENPFSAVDFKYTNLNNDLHKHSPGDVELDTPE